MFFVFVFFKPSPLKATSFSSGIMSKTSILRLMDAGFEYSDFRDSLGRCLKAVTLTSPGAQPGQHGS